MYKQTLCVTLPISASVIIAAALFANAGDLNPPDGPIGSTMHDLQEIYDLVQQSSPCGGCTWLFKNAPIAPGGEILAISGAGEFHGLWLKGLAPNDFSSRVVLWDGISEDRIKIVEFGMNGSWSQFFQLDVPFGNGLYVEATGLGDAEITLLYRSTNP